MTWNGAIISTQGDLANAIEAQSIGGGGGNGGFAVSASGSEYAAGSLSLGGAGGDGGSASTVTVGSTGNLQTTGTQSDGILAQSIGGGGGNGGFAISGALSFSPDVGAGSLAIGGGGGSGAAWPARSA